MTKTILFVFIAFISLIAISTAQSTICTSQTNVSTGQVMAFSLNNVAYHVVQNFITPDYAGITINGVSYTVYPNAPYTINQNTGAYVELAQINYIPKISSVNLILCSGQQTANTEYNFNLSANNYGDLYFTALGTKLIIGADVSLAQASTNFPTNVTIANVSGSAPSPPSGYTELTTLSISVTTTANITLNLTQHVPCYVSASTVAVYKLMGGSWVLVPNTYNATACAVSAIIPSDPTVGIFYNSHGSTAPTTSTIPATTQPTSSVYTTRTTSSTSSTSSTSIYTTSSTTRTSTSTTSSSSVYTSITIPPQTTVPASSINQIQVVDWVRYAILVAIALLVIYLLYLVFHKWPV